MRIERIRVEGFGRLHALDTGSDALGELVVVAGSNEAGKSTLFTFLTTTLYGFQPATRERNPHVPWGVDEAAGMITVRLDRGGCGEIERRLRSQPTGHFTIDGVRSELRNQPVPWAGHVPRTVFRQVFAITLGDLAALDADTWARIQDSVVGSMGASDLRSVRSVAEELEREAGEIWRPSRRGNQRLRDVQGEARALRGRRAAARDRDATIRSLVEERESTETRLQEAREKRNRERLSLDRARRLLPVTRQLERIERLREEGGDPSLLEGLPSDPTSRLRGLVVERARSENRLSNLLASMAEREEERSAFDARARKLLGRRDDVARLLASAGRCSAERARIAELQLEIDGIELELDAASASVLDTSWREVPRDTLTSVPVESLRSLLVRLGSSTATSGSTPSPRPAQLGVLAAGLGLLILGLLRGSPVATTAGASLSAVALTLVLSERHARHLAARTSAEERATREQIRALLRGVPIRAERLDQPDEALVHGLTRLASLTRDYGRRLLVRDATRGRVTDADRHAAELARTLGLDGSTLGLDGSTDADAVARALDLEVRRAERLQETSNAAEREIHRLAGERETVAAELDEVTRSLATLQSRGERLVAGDAAAGLELAEARIEAHRRADQLREELVRSYPDLSTLEQQILASERTPSPDSWSMDDEQVARAQARLESLEEEIESLLKKSEALARDAAHLRGEETVDAVDGEIDTLRETERSLARERDRKWLLARLLREADRRFREQHQPDLLRRASAYLEHLTGGRYERLLVDDRDAGHPFQVVGPGLPAPIPLAPPVSTGTLEQAYLSLRLAIVDHLDQGGERLPLFVDEVFVNWDRHRRKRGLEVLSEVASSRQVFVFTCHRDVADELCARGGGILSLDRAE